MKKIANYLALTFVLFSVGSYAQSQASFEFAQQISGSANVQPKSIYTDVNGDLIVVGSLEGTADFDPSSGTTNLSSNGSLDVFITKYSSSGQLIWAKSVGSNLEEFITASTVDELGNVYIAGNFHTTVDFDPSSSTFLLPSLDNSSIFLLKLDNNGDFAWVKGYYASGNYAGITSLSVAEQQNIYATGIFTGTLNFTQGTTTDDLDNHTFSPKTFMTKLLFNGSHIWSNALDGGNYSYGKKIIKSNGSIYLLGEYIGLVDFDPSLNTFTMDQNKNAFIAKYNNLGSFIWAKSLRNLSQKEINLEDAIINNNDELFITGNFIGTIDLDPDITGTFTLSSPSNPLSLNDGFTAKYDANGNFIWASQLKGSNKVVRQKISSDYLGNIYTTGFFSDTLTHDSIGVNIQVIAAGSDDFYIEKLDANGNYIWSQTFGGLEEDVSSSIVVDDSLNIYTSGYFRGTVDFDPSLSTALLTSSGSTYSDMFIQKLHLSDPIGVSENTKITLGKVYPNPTSGSFVIEFADVQKSVSITISSILGQEILYKEYTDAKELNLTIDGNKGLYIVNVQTDDGQFSTFKIMKE